MSFTRICDYLDEKFLSQKEQPFLFKELSSDKSVSFSSFDVFSEFGKTCDNRILSDLLTTLEKHPGEGFICLDNYLLDSSKKYGISEREAVIGESGTLISLKHTFERKFNTYNLEFHLLNEKSFSQRLNYRGHFKDTNRVLVIKKFEIPIYSNSSL